MASPVSYADIQGYLDAIADNPQNGGDIANSLHERFWNVSYAEFVGGSVPNESCRGAPIPIVDKDPTKCPFYQSLKNPNGWCDLKQMPKGGGPYITDAGYKVTLRNGTVISGTEIDANIVWWLTHNMPET
jgi:hypothetical protein